MLSIQELVKRRNEFVKAPLRGWVVPSLPTIQDMYFIPFYNKVADSIDKGELNLEDRVAYHVPSISTTVEITTTEFLNIWIVWFRKKSIELNLDFLPLTNKYTWLKEHYTQLEDLIMANFDPKSVNYDSIKRLVKESVTFDTDSSNMLFPYWLAIGTKATRCTYVYTRGPQRTNRCLCLALHVKNAEPRCYTHLFK